MQNLKASGWKVNARMRLAGQPDRFIVEQLDVSRGDKVRMTDYLIVGQPDSVQVVGLDIETLTIFANLQDRVAGGWMIETFAGGCRPDETMEGAARREFEEEAGLIAETFLRLPGTVPFGHRFINANIPSSQQHQPMTNHCFVALNPTATQTNREPDEIIHVIELNLSEAVEAVTDGKILPQFGIPILHETLAYMLLLLHIRKGTLCQEEYVND